MSKAGINQHIKVTIDLDLTNVSQVEFLFRQVKSMNGTVYKEEIYSTNSEESTVTLTENGIFLVPFPKEDTYLFKQNSPFYMDTRITMSNTTDNPETQIVELFMNPTLFGSED